MKQLYTGMQEKNLLGGLLTHFEILSGVYNILRMEDCLKCFRKLKANSS